MGTDDSAKVRIDLTDDQKQTIKAAIDRDADAIELTVQELEQRITPTGTTVSVGMIDGLRLAGNHNETLLEDAG